MKVDTNTLMPIYYFVMPFMWQILTSLTGDIQREKFTWDASDGHLMCPS